MTELIIVTAKQLDELSTEEILEYLSDTVVDPEEIFTTTQLSEWAEENGYTKEQ